MSDLLHSKGDGPGVEAGASRRVILALGLSGLLALAGCASLSESQCRNARWGEIGLADGRAGAPLSRLADHGEACAKVGVVPDEPLWRAGREEGLLAYCTAASGRDVGLRGGVYAGVCPGASDAEFRRGLGVGRQIADLQRLLASNRREQQALIDRLARSDVPEVERRTIRQRLLALDIDEDRLRRVLSTTERQPL